MTLIEDVVSSETQIADRHTQRGKRVAKTLGTSSAKFSRGLIITLTLITLACHVVTSVMLFFPAYECVFSDFVIHEYRAFSWAWWFVDSIVIGGAILFLVFGFFKSTLYHSINYEIESYYEYWLFTFITYTFVTIHVAYIYDKFSGLGAPDTWVNFFAISAYDTLGMECVFFFVGLQVYGMLSIYNWINSYKKTIWNFFKIYELNDKVKTSLDYGVDVVDSRLLNNRTVVEMIDR